MQQGQGHFMHYMHRAQIRLLTEVLWNAIRGKEFSGRTEAAGSQLWSELDLQVK
jgi:hypothetical protein